MYHCFVGIKVPLKGTFINFAFLLIVPALFSLNHVWYAVLSLMFYQRRSGQFVCRMPDFSTGTSHTNNNCKVFYRLPVPSSLQHLTASFAFWGESFLFTNHTHGEQPLIEPKPKTNQPTKLFIFITELYISPKPNQTFITRYVAPVPAHPQPALPSLLSRCRPLLC